MIIDPWGRVLAQLHEGEGEGYIVAEADLHAQALIRQRLPSLVNRRPGAYRWPEEASNRWPQEARDRWPQEASNRWRQEARDRWPEEASNRRPQEARDRWPQEAT
jgi:hypothetical protein